jgi:hypothetical protein
MSDFFPKGPCLSPRERDEVARQIADQWSRQLSSQPISPEDLGSILPAAVGLLLGRRTLTPEVAIKIFSQGFQLGQKERLVN